MTKLTELKANAGSRKPRTRLGRGNGSKGTFCGKGCKGHNARSGGGKRINFEGGQTPLLKRIPKLRGFKCPNHVDFAVFNLSDLERVYTDGEIVDHHTLAQKNLLSKSDAPVKILGSGNLSKKLEVVVEAVSASAKKAIESAGGKITITLVKVELTERQLEKKAERAAKKARK